MITIDKLNAVTHLIAHANCPDGVASALIVRDALPDVRVSFVKYGSEEHRNSEPAPGMLFCDFSPWLPKDGDLADVISGARYAGGTRESLIEQWRKAGVIVLDHHARDVVEPYEFGVFGENERLECGAMLAFKQVWLPLHDFRSSSEADHVFNFAELCAVRDTWKRDDQRFQRARDVGELLLFWRTKLRLSHYFDLPPGPLPLAERLFERAEEHARTSIDEAYRFITKRGTRVLMFQGVSTTSDAAELLEQEDAAAARDGRGDVLSPDLVVGFHYRVDGGKLQLQFSTRSHTGYDCQALARAHGGNGHKAAAGFTVEAAPDVILGNPYQTFQVLLEMWEAGR